jgi:hypothetical protein
METMTKWGEVLNFFILDDIQIEGVIQELPLCMVKWYNNGEITNRYGVTSFSTLTLGSTEARGVDELNAMIAIHHEGNRFYVVDKDIKIIPNMEPVTGMQ